MEELPQSNLIIPPPSEDRGSINALNPDPPKHSSPFPSSDIPRESRIPPRPSVRRSHFPRRPQSKAKRIISTITDYLLMFILLIASIPNYSILSLPYLFCGLIYIFLIQSSTPLSKTTKLILEIILSVYALACIIFKAIICAKSDTIQSNYFYIALGVAYLKDKSFLFGLFTFLSDIIVLVIGIFAVIMSFISKNIKHFPKAISIQSLTFRSSCLIWLVYLTSVGFCSFNLSISSIFTIIPANISLFMWIIITKQHKALIYIMKTCHVFIIASSAFVLVLNAVFNITEFIPVSDNGKEWSERFGVMFMLLKTKDDFHFTSSAVHLCFCSCAAVTIMLSATAFKLVNLSKVIKQNNNNNNMQHKQHKHDKDIHSSKVNSNNNKSFCINLYRTIAQYLKSPYFILHFCRIGVIVWLYLYRLYISCALLVWLFVSFLVIKVRTLKYYNYILLWPSLFYTCYAFHFTNIRAMYEKPSDIEKEIKNELWGVKVFQYSQYLEYPFIHLVIMLCSLYNKAMIISEEQGDESEGEVKGKEEVKEQTQHKKGDNIEGLLLSDMDKIKEEIKAEDKKVKDVDVDNDNVAEKKVPLIDKDEHKEEQLLIDDNKESKANVDETKQQKDKELRLMDIIVKFFLIHIDKITLVCMYLTAMDKVNVIHFILVVIFMIQLVYPKAIEPLCFFIIILIQLLFAIEYIFDIAKVFLYPYIKSDDAGNPQQLMKIIKFIVSYSDNLKETSVEVLLLLGIYCFYIQHQNYHSQVYSQLIKEKEHNTLSHYIDQQFIHLPTLKKVLFFLGNFILELYVWILIILVFFFLCHFEINIFFAIKFIMFLIILYQFLSSLQGSSSNACQLCFYWTFLIFCSLNTLIVYFYQFTVLDLFKEKFEPFAKKTFGTALFNNFPVIGLTDYSKDNSWVCFLPHFALNFISVLFYAETKRLIAKNRNPIDYTELTKQMLRNEEQKHLELINNTKMPSEEKKVRIKEKYDDNKKTIHRSTLLQYIFEVIIFLSKFYWLIIFNVICILFTNAELSLVLVIYIALFAITFILMYYKIINSLSKFMKRPSFFLSKLIRKSLTEDVFHLKQTKRYRYVGFQMLFVFSILLFTLIYAYGVFDFVQNGSQIKPNSTEYAYAYDDVNNISYNIKPWNTTPIIENNSTVENYTKSISFVVGVYVDLTKAGMIKTNIIHFVLFLFICADAYVQKLQNYFSDKAIEKKQLVKKLSKHNAMYKARFLHDNNILKEIGLNINQLGKQPLLPFTNIVSSISGGNEAQQQQQQGMKEDDKIDEQNDSISDLDALENIKRKHKDDYLIEQFKYIFIKAGTQQEELSVHTSNNKNKFIKATRKIFEEVTILMFIIIALSKINILSYIYMLIVIYLYLTKRSMKKFYNMLIILVVLLIIQCFMFLSNLSVYTAPDSEKNKDILQLVNNTLHIPWYPGMQLDSEKAFFLALGTNKLQIRFLWLDFLLISIIYVYLDYFSYAIYQDSDEDMKKIVEEQLKHNSQLEQQEEGKIGLLVDDNDNNNNNNNIKDDSKEDKEQPHKSKLKLYSLTGKKKLLRSVQNMQLEEFTKHKENLQYTFNIDIGEYATFKETFLYHGREKLQEIEEEDKMYEMEEPSSLQQRLKMKNRSMNKFIKGEKKKKSSKCFKSLKTAFYLYLHNFVLTAIIIISMLISGLISAIYISFSLYFLMKSASLILGNKCDYPKAIKTFMRIIIVTDILVQLIFQSPFLAHEKGQLLDKILKTIGVNTIITFEDKTDPNESIKIDSNESVFIYAKAFICFIMSIQVVVYSSEDFQTFYLSYILTKKDLTRKLAFVNVFWFNNKRIEQMAKEFEHRKNMKKAMTTLETMLEEWDQKLGSVSTRSQLITGEIKDKDNKDKDKEIDNDDIQQQQLDSNEILIAPPQHKQSSLETTTLLRRRKLLPSQKQPQQNLLPQYLDENDVKTRLKSHILNKFLVKILLSLHKSNPNYNSIEKTEREDFIKDIIIGKTELLTIIERETNIELDSLDLTEITEKDIPIITSIIDNAVKLQNEEETRINNERKERERKEQQRKTLILAGTSEDKIDDVVAESKPLIMLDSLIEKDEKEKDKKLSEKEKEKAEHEKYLSSPKFLQVKRLVTHKTLFKKYLRTSYILGLIVEDIFYFISSNSHYLCFVIMLITHLISTSMLSLVYPLGIFCFGLYANPRPGKTFWNLNMMYTIVVIILKFVLNLKVLLDVTGFKAVMQEVKNWKVGFECFEDTFSNEYFKYILFDTLVLFFLFLQEYILISMGLWNQTEKEIENIHQAYERIFVNQNKKMKNVKKFNEQVLLEKSKESLFLSLGSSVMDEYANGSGSDENEEMISNENESEVINESEVANEQQQQQQQMDVNNEYEEQPLLEPNINDNNNNNSKEQQHKKQQKTITKYFESLFPKIRNEKPGSTYYTTFTILLMLIIIYLILFYTKMDQDRTFGEVSMETTQFSGAMVLWVFVYVIFAVIDRVIYIRQSRNHLRFEYKFYHKSTGQLATSDEVQSIEDSVYENHPELAEKKHFEIPLLRLEQIEQQYNIVIIQKEPTNYPLIMKYILNLVITLTVHITAFFFLPMYGNMKLTGNVHCAVDGEGGCNDFLSNIWIIMFYLLNLLYIFVSSLQIKYGYLDMIPKSLLKTGETPIHSGIHTGYKAIPFLYELKLAIDWTFTRTSLDIFQWNKFESVYDILYTTLCAKKFLKEWPVGMRVSNVKKGGLGVPIFSGILLLLIGPLLLFSNLNPINQLNNITGASIEMQISIKQGTVYKNYSLFKNDHVDSLDDLDDAKWQKYKYNISSYSKNFPRDQVQVVRMSNTSDNNWALAVPHIQHIIHALSICNETHVNGTSNITCDYTSEIDLINLKFYYEFTRPKPENNKDSLKDIDYYLFDKKNKSLNRGEQVITLRNAISNCTGEEITLKSFYYPGIRLSSDPHPKVLLDKEVFDLISMALKFNCEKEESSDVIEYYKSYFELYKKDTNDTAEERSIEFHTFSDKISDVTSGYSVITFYVTFVLLAGNYVRNFFTGAPEKIMLTELPDPRQLINLCEGIKTSRYSFELEKEEQLYYVLIEFIRSPEYLRMITKSSVNMFKERKANLKRPEIKEDKDETD